MAIVILAKTIIKFTFQFLRGYSFHSNESFVQAVYTPKAHSPSTTILTICMSTFETRTNQT